MAKRRSGRLRRLTVGTLLVTSLLGFQQQQAKAQDFDDFQIICFFALGTSCFAMAEACDALPFVPEEWCTEAFIRCAELAIEICFGQT